MHRNEAALVVDDDDFVRRLLIRQLTSLGFTRVEGAANGATARAHLAGAERLGLVICDLVMPDVDGVELIREIAQLQPQAPVVLVSRMDPKMLRSVEALARERALWILGALQKPVRIDQLQALVAQIAAGPPRARVVAEAVQVGPDELRAALEAGAIEAWVQPKVAVADGALAGVEALARWPRPGQPAVPPDVFIAVAEQHGLIDALTETMLRQALQACGDWERGGLRTHVSVNIAVASLNRLRLPETITGLAAGYGVEPQQVTIEVTESGVMADPVMALDILTRLRLRGFALSIDDFGAGYSSLKQLRRVPFTELKIDMSFVRPMLEDEEAARIVQSSVRLAQELELTSVAEGVESARHLERLRAFGCDVAQGYFIARPFPAAQLPEWARARQVP
jgi:EAL domain-containing protein (putative c-di-GMP-specific phosphodiesterase class I)/FixJ family two-component response regulator